MEKRSYQFLPSYLFLIHFIFNDIEAENIYNLITLVTKWFLEKYPLWEEVKDNIDRYEQINSKSKSLEVHPCETERERVLASKVLIQYYKFEYPPYLNYVIN